MEKFTRIEPPATLSKRWQALLWVFVMAALIATFLGYGQLELLIHWVSVQLC